MFASKRFDFTNTFTSSKSLWSYSHGKENQFNFNHRKIYYCRLLIMKSWFEFPIVYCDGNLLDSHYPQSASWLGSHHPPCHASLHWSVSSVSSLTGLTNIFWRNILPFYGICKHQYYTLRQYMFPSLVWWLLGLFSAGRGPGPSCSPSPVWQPRCSHKDRCTHSASARVLSKDAFGFFFLSKFQDHFL